jgi:hypothetical protein
MRGQALVEIADLLAEVLFLQLQQGFGILLSMLPTKTLRNALNRLAIRVNMVLPRGPRRSA